MPGRGPGGLSVSEDEKRSLTQRASGLDELAGDARKSRERVGGEIRRWNDGDSTSARVS